MLSKMLLALIVTLTLSACATSTPRSMRPTGLTQVPSECLTECPEIPSLLGLDEISRLIWIHEVLHATGRCRRMHHVCRLSKQE